MHIGLLVLTSSGLRTQFLVFLHFQFADRIPEVGVTVSLAPWVCEEFCSLRGRDTAPSMGELVYLLPGYYLDCYSVSVKRWGSCHPKAIELLGTFESLTREDLVKTTNAVFHSP